MATTSITDGPAVPPRCVNPKVLALAAVLSLFTSPVTAIWFLLIAPLVLALSAIWRSWLEARWTEASERFASGSVSASAFS